MSVSLTKTLLSSVDAEQPPRSQCHCRMETHNQSNRKLQIECYTNVFFFLSFRENEMLAGWHDAVRRIKCTEGPWLGCESLRNNRGHCSKWHRAANPLNFITFCACISSTKSWKIIDAVASRGKKEVAWKSCGTLFADANFQTFYLHTFECSSKMA